MTASLVDLEGQAGRRAARARLLGRLLVDEPTPADLKAARSVPSLAAALAGSGHIAADYSAVLLREVPCYQSVFLGRTGQMGRVDPDLLALYRQAQFDPDRYRVAAPDQLGVQLLCLAQLCDDEREGWGGDRPDRATRAVELQRHLLAHHLGAWAPVAAEALGRAGRGTVYEPLAEVLVELLADESQRLRPEPLHPEAPEDDDPPAPAGRIEQRLLAPACAGGFLLADDVAPLAAALEVPWRPSDTRSRLGHVVTAALDAERTDLLAVHLGPVVDRWAQRWADQRDRQAGAARIHERWRRRATATRQWLDGLPQRPRRGPATLIVGDDARRAAVVAELSASGLIVTVDPAPDAIRDRVEAVVRVEPGAEERWEGDPPPGWIPHR